MSSRTVSLRSAAAAAWLAAALALGHTSMARAQCVSSRETLDCCTMFEAQAPYDTRLPDGGVSTKCRDRPTGTVCYAFDDDYVWLLSLSSPGVGRAECPEGRVHIMFEDDSTRGAKGALYLHLDGTDQIKTLRPCAGEGALDPRACDADVSIAVFEDAGYRFMPVDRLGFDPADVSGEPDAGVADEADGEEPAPTSDPSAGQDFAPARDDGCSVPATSGGGGVWALFAFGALLVRRRRRD